MITFEELGKASAAARLGCAIDLVSETEVPDDCMEIRTEIITLLRAVSEKISSGLEMTDGVIL